MNLHRPLHLIACRSAAADRKPGALWETTEKVEGSEGEGEFTGADSEWRGASHSSASCVDGPYQSQQMNDN